MGSTDWKYHLPVTYLDRVERYKYEEVVHDILQAITSYSTKNYDNMQT
jgi:predicted site-specific integrase-resolvase